VLLTNPKSLSLQVQLQNIKFIPYLMHIVVKQKCRKIIDWIKKYKIEKEGQWLDRQPMHIIEKGIREI
jgi:hypothetical protein